MLEILRNKEDLVFVGGFALMKHGLRDSYRDIDIVVENLEGLVGFTEYETDSAFSKSGKRAFIIGEKVIDIFIEDKIPDYEIIDGLKIQTKESLLNHFTEILPLIKDYWKPAIEEKINLLKNKP